MPPIANQGRDGRWRATWASNPRPAAGRPGLVGVTHTGPGFGRRGAGLAGIVAAAADQRARAENAPGDRHWQVVLAEVEHVGARREGHIRPVVDRQQAAVPPACVGEHLQQPEFLACFEPLLPQLDDVHPGAQHRVEELRQVPPGPPGVGA
jgi:hypothetical protein